VRLLGSLIFAILSICPTARATIVIPNADSCYTADVNAALNQIRASDPELAKAIKALEASKTPYLIWKSNTIISGTTDGDEWIEWNRDLNIPFPGEEGTCVDPTAGLAHELWHKYDIDRCRNGAGDTFCDPTHPEKINRTSDASTNGIPRSEIRAVDAENLYRFGATPQPLCRRWKYGNNPLPAPHFPTVHCPVRGPAEACPIPPVWSGTCPRYCCLVYNFDGKGNGCWKDNLTVKECSGSLIIKDKGQNAGETAHPCSEAIMKYKPCPF